VLISIAVMLNTFGNVSTQVLVKARTWYAMAKDGLFFKSFSKIHPKYKTPNVALLVQGAWATVLLLGAAFAESAYEAMIDFFSFTSTVFNIMTFASVWVLRKKFPDIHRPYKAWGYPLTLFLVLTIQIWFLITTLITAFLPSMIGAALTCSGLIYYFRDDIRNIFSKRG
jgi:amino acid transporter